MKHFAFIQSWLPLNIISSDFSSLSFSSLPRSLFFLICSLIFLHKDWVSISLRLKKRRTQVVTSHYWVKNVEFIPLVPSLINIANGACWVTYGSLDSYDLYYVIINGWGVAFGCLQVGFYMWYYHTTDHTLISSEVELPTWEELTLPVRNFFSKTS